MLYFKDISTKETRRKKEKQKAKKRNDRMRKVGIRKKTKKKKTRTNKTIVMLSMYYFNVQLTIAYRVLYIWFYSLWINWKGRIYNLGFIIMCSIRERERESLGSYISYEIYANISVEIKKENILYDIISTYVLCIYISIYLYVCISDRCLRTFSYNVLKNVFFSSETWISRNA